MLVNVVAYSIVYGLTSGVDTLASQAYGAGNMMLVGNVLLRAIAIVTVACIPCCIFLFYSHHLLSVAGVRQELVALCQTYTRWMLFSIWPYGITSCIEKYLETQGITWPCFVAAGTAIVVHAPLAYTLIHVTPLGFIGAPISIAASQTLLVIALVVCVRVKRLHVETWPGITREMLREWGPYLALAVPGMLQIGLEWWFAELMALLAGKLDDASVAAQSVLGNTNAFGYMTPYG